MDEVVPLHSDLKEDSGAILSRSCAKVVWPPAQDPIDAPSQSMVPGREGPSRWGLDYFVMEDYLGGAPGDIHDFSYFVGS